MKRAMRFPQKVQGRVSDETARQIAVATERFGASESTLVRMGLEDFLPRYLAAQGRGGDTDLIAQIGEALKRNPALKGEIEALIRKGLRNQRRAAA